MPAVDILIVNPAEYLGDPGVAQLVAANWAETGFDFPFAPDVAAYQRLWDAGLCFALLAVDAATQAPAGYCTVTVVAHPYNPDVLLAANDAMFVAPAHRNGLLTGRLIHAAQEEAKRRGARCFTWHCRAGTGFAAMLAQHGYTPVDEVVMRTL
jgi:GNAT superfamily N-acetyltransferase